MNIYSGLTIEESNSIFLQYRERYQWKARMLAGVGAGVVAAIYAVAIPIISLSIYPVSLIPSPKGDYWIHADGSVAPQMTIPGSGIASLVLSSVFDFFTFAFVGWGVYQLLDRYLIQKKVDELSKYILGLKENYESASLIDSETIRSLFKKVDKTARTEMLAEMSFAQLKIARRLVSPQTFRATLQKSNLYGHYIWRHAVHIIETCHTPKEMQRKIEYFKNNKLDARSFKNFISGLKDLYEDNPEFLTIIQGYVSLNTENSDEAILSNRKPTLARWESLWHQAVASDSDTMKNKLKAYAINQLERAMQLPSNPNLTSLWLARTLLSCDFSNYSVVIDKSNFLMAFKVGEYLRTLQKNDKIYNDVLAFCAANPELVKNNLFGSLNSLPQPIVEILYPNQTQINNGW